MGGPHRPPLHRLTPGYVVGYTYHMEKQVAIDRAQARANKEQCVIYVGMRYDCTYYISKRQPRGDDGGVWRVAMCEPKAAA